MAPRAQHLSRRRASAVGPRNDAAAGAPTPDRVAAAGETEPPGALTIGELAARAGVTPEAIRYYEREGVVPPAARGGAGRYRRCGEADVERLRFVRRALDLGFGLDEVRELLGLAGGDLGRPCGEVNRIARAHLAAVDAQLARLAARRGELARVITACDAVAPVSECRILGALSGA